MVPSSHFPDAASVQESLDYIILWAVGTMAVLLLEAAVALKHSTRRICAF